MNLVYLQVNDPKVPVSPKLVPGFVDPNGQYTDQCLGCHKEIKFDVVLQGCTIEAVACPDCKNQFTWPEMPKLPEPVTTEKDEERLPRKPKEKKGLCPECGGLPRGRGWKHKTIKGQPCPNSTQVKLAEQSNSTETCPHCGGPKRGRGFIHNDVNGQPCPYSTVAKLAKAKTATKTQSPGKDVETCPHCGGPKRGRGFTHNDIDGQPCPGSTAAKLDKAKASTVKPQTETCPHCGGPKRGRGFTHKKKGGKLCPLSTEARLAAKQY